MVLQLAWEHGAQEAAGEQTAGVGGLVLGGAPVEVSRMVFAARLGDDPVGAQRYGRGIKQVDGLCPIGKLRKATQGGEPALGVEHGPRDTLRDGAVDDVAAWA